jgi:hypothetical protein
VIIPNAELATVDIQKLRYYCLDTLHETGKHKARKFMAALGMTADDAEGLQDVLLEIVKTHDAELATRDEYGPRYRIDFILEWKGRTARIRSGWIIEVNSTIPRLTSCYVL